MHESRIAPEHPSPASGAAAYYPGIDGLRALAVLSVVIFHLHAAWLPGGFVGVDVFFVVSGFVVTLSVAKLEAGSLRAFMAVFYARRFLRIAPALLVCLFVVMIASTLFIPRAYISYGISRTGLAAFVGLSNVLLSQTANDYFATQTEFNPFTHTWSLGVEEQFYLLFPFLLYGFLKYRHDPARRHAAAAAVAVLALGSLAWCAWASKAAPVDAFYLLPARFWELACGAALALSWDRWRRPLQAARTASVRLLAWLCLAALLLGFLVAEAGDFPFPWAILPVLATAGLLAIVVARPDVGVSRLLVLPPLRYLGKISYSLYLWHWPVFVLFRWTVGLDGPAQWATAAVLSFALGAASYRWIENPVRAAQRLRVLRRSMVIVLALGGIATVGTASAMIARNHQLLSLSVTRDTTTWTPDSLIGLPGVEPACKVRPQKRPFVGGELVLMSPSGCKAAAARPERLFVAGDSHAWAYTAMLRLYAEQSGREVKLFTQGGCSVFNLRVANASSSPACVDYANAVLREIATTAQPGDVLFLPSLRVERLREQTDSQDRPQEGPAAAPARRQAVAEAIAALQPLAARGVVVVFEAPKPVLRVQPFRCSDWFNRGNPSCPSDTTVSRAELEERRHSAMLAIAEVTGRVSGAAVWDPFNTLCPGSACAPTRDGKPLYFDGDHLSGYGNTVMLPAFRTFMRRVWTADGDRG